LIVGFPSAFCCRFTGRVMRRIQIAVVNTERIDA
jgi:hypothetical protein